jgi:hypothetical protein
MKKTRSKKSRDTVPLNKVGDITGHIINFNPGGYIKRTLTGSLQLILTSIFKWGVGNVTYVEILFL